ncbi:hypothetical protein O3P69_012094 [Scylla paramamosain]|uniref:Reverse transcriptase/retrotransposon-derived protein RNase H-like domain-containing protein n=1 Tax=Scylla paramamosain TaxID=85552 RepID=A0AAW0TCG6_SCYPA
MEAPVLPYPDPKLPYLLDTDASAEGVGAVLSQCAAVYVCLQTPPSAMSGGVWRSAVTPDLAPVVRWLEASDERPSWQVVAAESPAAKCLTVFRVQPARSGARGANRVQAQCSGTRGKSLGHSEGTMPSSFP